MRRLLLGPLPPEAGPPSEPVEAGVDAPASIDPLSSKQPAIVFHVEGASPFQFVLERAKSLAPPLPSLKVTYCP